MEIARGHTETTKGHTELTKGRTELILAQSWNQFRSSLVFLFVRQSDNFVILNKNKGADGIRTRVASFEVRRSINRATKFLLKIAGQNSLFICTLSLLASVLRRSVSMTELRVTV